MSDGDPAGRPGHDELRRLVVRADEIAKAAPAAADPARVRDRARGVLDEVRRRLDDLPVVDQRDRMFVDTMGRQVSRRMLDLDGADLAATARPSDGMRRAPTDVDEPGRVPPNQHLTPGFPVLHVESPPRDTSGWSLTVSGRVHDRLTVGLDELQSDGATTVTSDFHCVTGWSRLDNDWTGVAVADLLDRAGVRPEGTHVLAYGHPAYSANLALAALRAPGVLVAWAHDGRALDVAHGGPLRLVVPQRYGWKSVKWLTELRVVDRDVPGYWEERGYHMHADPWTEERLAGD